MRQEGELLCWIDGELGVQGWIDQTRPDLFMPCLGGGGTSPDMPMTRTGGFYDAASGWQWA
jgi:hypothetical protein